MGRGWDETGEKGVYLVTLEETAQVKFLPADMPVFRELEADVSEDPVEAVATLLPVAESEDFFRITLTGAAELDMQKLQQRFSQVSNLTFRDRTEPPVDLWADAGADTLRGVYFRMLRELADTEEEAILAAEISQRILSGREVRFP